MDDIWRGRHCSSSFRFRANISWYSKGELYALKLGYFYSTSTGKHVLDFSFAKVILKSVLYDSFQGSSIGLYFINRPEWLITDHACSAYSYISVPLYDTLGIHLLVNRALFEA